MSSQLEIKYNKMAHALAPKAQIMIVVAKCFLT